jgi:hypothetical protein
LGRRRLCTPDSRARRQPLFVVEAEVTEVLEPMQERR